MAEASVLLQWGEWGGWAGGGDGGWGGWGRGGAVLAARVTALTQEMSWRKKTSTRAGTPGGTGTFRSGSSWRAACSRTRARAHTGVRGTCRAAPGRSTGGPPTRPPAAPCRRSSTAGRGRCRRGWGLCDAGTSPRRPWPGMWGGKARWFVPRSPGTLNREERQ